MATGLDILVTGGTGYIGGHLIPVLVGRGHRVRVLTRPQSVERVPSGAAAVLGDALDEASIAAALRARDTVIHLVGTRDPSPSNADQFETVDLGSIRATVRAAKSSAIAHLVYVSVAQPAPVNPAYLWIRTLGETMIREAGLTATILRPWRIVGPGRRWPKAMKPLYKLAELFPLTRATVQRLAAVTLDQFINALITQVEDPPASAQCRIVDVLEIKRLARESQLRAG